MAGDRKMEEGNMSSRDHALAVSFALDGGARDRLERLAQALKWCATNPQYDGALKLVSPENAGELAADLEAALQCNAPADAVPGMTSTLPVGEEEIARMIIGPRNPVPPSSDWSLEELRDVRWQMSSEADRSDALWAARAILARLRSGEG